MKYIAGIHNWLSDKDFVWWPFSFLRPKPNEFITFQLTLTMAACFGVLTGVILAFFYIANGAFEFGSSLFTLVICFVGFLVWFNIITRPLWNYRARQLQGAKKPKPAKK